MISILHLAYLLQKGTFNEKGHYALVLAPTKPLVHQHFTSFQTFLKLPKGAIIELSGAVTPDTREELEKEAKVIIATPQTIKNDIVQGRLDLTKCQLVYFDEAHRATGDYDYVPIADILHQYNTDIRIVALTASPGTKKEEIVEICRNLFIEAVESRTKDDPEIQRYVQETIIERMEVPLPFEFEEILEIIRHLGERELKILRKHQLTSKPFHFLYKGELLRIKKQLSKNFRANFFAIMACNRLLYIIILREALESQGVPSAYTLITNWQKKNSKSIKGLLNLEEFNLMIKKIEVLKKKGVIHPKLLFLYDILDKVDLINSRVLVFCNLRATCYAISNALVERGINAKPFVGQGSGSKKGLTQKKQLELLKAFREDQFPVLVSTSVLEEGLDVEECNLVVFYDGTASAIRKIQRVGRTGRKKKGKVIVLTTHHTIDTTAHFVSSAKERQMNKLLQDINWLEEELEKEPERETRAFAPESAKEPMVKEKEPVEKKQDQQNQAVITEKKEKKKKQETMIEIIVDSREKNSKILFYLKKEGIDLEFKQVVQITAHR
jgi:Fanconi anemia group M protein